MKSGISIKLIAQIYIVAFVALSLTGFMSDSQGVRFLCFLTTLLATGGMGYLLVNEIRRARDSGDTEWIKNNQMAITSELQSETEMGTFVGRLLKSLCPLLHCGAGVVYIYQKDKDELRVAGSWGSSPPDDKAARKPDSFLGGQALRDNRPISISRPKGDDKLNLDGGLQAVPVSGVIWIPIAFQGEVLGVLELWLVQELTGRGEQLLTTLADNLGAFIKNILNSNQQKILLKAAQIQTETLKNHARLLQKNNKTLESQKNVLDEKNARLEELKSKLQEKTRELESTSSYKTQFLANMSHELRTPLNSIMIFSELMAEDRLQILNDEYKEYARSINTSGRTLLDLIGDILDLSKVEAGKLDIVPRNMNLQEFAAEIRTQFQKAAENKGLELVIDIDAALPGVIVIDPLRLSQIIRNFLSNALKFTKEGSITLSINRPSSPEDVRSDLLRRTNLCCFSVTDTGMGIPAEKQAKIFEEFSQADQDTAHRYGGTGLGLAISRRLTGLMGGEIVLESEEGKGSTFRVYFPETLPEAGTASEPQPVAENRPAPAVAETPVAPASPAFARESGGVLIIEDDEKFSGLLAEEVRATGFDVHCFVSCEEAREFMKSHLPRAILLDLVLPGMDGRVFLRELQTSPEYCDIPVHVISGRDEKGVVEAGAVGFYKKPISTRDIDAMLGQISGDGQRRRVLVIEDDLQHQAAIKSLLLSRYVDVFCVSTAEEAMSYIRDIAFSCIIVDLNLPGVGGDTFLEQIRESGNQTPVIVYTGQDMESERVTSLQNQANSLIQKGADGSRSLLDAVSRFMEGIPAAETQGRADMPPPAPAQPVTSKESTGPVPAPHNFSGYSALIVDDQPQNIFALASFLEGLQMKVIKAQSGARALEKIAEKPDIILMDIMMPGMDGFEATKRIKDDKSGAGIPVIAVTADIQQVKGEAGRLFDDTMAKPVDTGRLAEIISRLLGKTPLRKAG